MWSRSLPFAVAPTPSTRTRILRPSGGELVDRVGEDRIWSLNVLDPDQRADQRTCTALSAEELRGAGVQNIEGLVRIECLGHCAHSDPLILVRLPIGLGHASDQGVKEIAGVEVAFGQRFEFERAGVHEWADRMLRWRLGGSLLVRLLGLPSLRLGFVPEPDGRSRSLSCRTRSTSAGVISLAKGTDRAVTPTTATQRNCRWQNV